jgi:Tfp pilus assembly protein PilN
VIYLKTSVGIEIRQDDLLITCLRSNFAGGVFTHFKRIAGYHQRDSVQVRAEIDEFFKGERISRDNIVLGLPRKDVTLRYLDLPKEVEDNLKQVMLYQVQSFEPTEEDKLYYDFMPIKDGQLDKRIRVLAIMVRKSILDAHLETMRQLGIRPSAVTAGSLALANMFLGTHTNGKDKTFVLIDLKTEGMELSVLRGGALVYGREAIRPADLPMKQWMLSEIDVAVGKVRLDPEETIEGIILSGEGSESTLQELQEEMPGCELMSDRLRFEMSPKNKTFLPQAVTSLGLAYGGISRRLAMKLNLLPSESRVRQKRWAYIPTIILGICIAGALIGLAFRNMVQQQILIRNLDQEIKTLDAPANRVKDLRNKAMNLEKRIGSVEEVLYRRDQNLDLLRELTNLLPTDTFLTMYRNQDCTIQMRGNSPPTSTSDLMGKLEKSPLLRDISTSAGMYRDPQTGKDVFNFTAKCEK